VADSAAFDRACTELERLSNLDRLEARGTVRLALKQSGLEARTVTPDQMKVVLDKVLPGELASRGIDDASICQTIAGGLAGLDAGPIGDSPDAVFERLGGGA